MMNLESLVSNTIGINLLQGDQLDLVGYIWADSRKIKKHDIFVVSDSSEDLIYMDSAVENGSNTCLISKDSKLIQYAKNKFKNVLISEESSTQKQGYIASFLLDHPSKKLEVIAVTGTNGKTSLTHILYHFATSLGYTSGLIGTIYTKFNNTSIDTGYTTPDSSSLQILLKQMLDEGIQFVFMEASSHGLKLGRTNGVHLRAALFTNLTKDHLDFHQSMEDYLVSKFRIFTLLDESEKNNKFGILNMDSPGGLEMERLIIEKKISTPIFYLGKNRDFEVGNPNLRITGTSFIFSINLYKSTFSRMLRIFTNLLGGFNVFNLSLAIACWIKIDIDTIKLTSLCESIPRIPGRFDIYPNQDQDRIAIVDYAHTPDALMNILKSAKELNPSELICLFGCGGDRDKTKRPEMASIAEQISDFVVLTSDNPRTEDPNSILDEIMKGFTNPEKVYRQIDRKLAIEFAINKLKSGGILAVCGKGHETVQIIGKEKFHFDDGEEVEVAWKKTRENRI